MGILLLLGGAAANGCAPAEPTSWDASRSLIHPSATLDIRPASPTLRRLPSKDPACAGILQLEESFRKQLQARRPPDNLLETMAHCLIRDGRHVTLVDLLLQAVRAFPEDLPLQLQLTTFLLDLGDEGEALRRLAWIRQQAPDHAEALFLEGLIYSQLPGSNREQLQLAVERWSRLLVVVEDPRTASKLSAETIRQVREQLTRMKQALSEPADAQDAP